MIQVGDYTKPKGKRAVGRPTENPFTTPESEEEFAVVGQAMLYLYYRPEKDKRSDFVFSPFDTLSKTEFWAFIFIYFTHRKGMKRNLQGFMKAVIRYFGPSVSCDRGRVCKNVSALLALEVTHVYTSTLTHPADIRAQEKARKSYQYVIGLWKEQEEKTHN